MEFSLAIANPEILRSLLQREAWATYYVGRYYFKVNTGKKLEVYGLKAGDNIDVTTQRILQKEHLVALFHEYIHYIHEISTVMGHIGLNLDLAMKSIFSHYFDPVLASCLHRGIDVRDTPRFENYGQYYASKHILFGSVEKNLKLFRISAITYTKQPVYMPDETGPHEFIIDIPEIEANVYMGGRQVSQRYIFGKFFLYEGLAYELDRELDRQSRGVDRIQDTARFTEYTVLREVALFIWPDVIRRIYLTIASLALSYLDAGRMFIVLLKEVKQAVENGRTLEEVMEEVRRREGKMLMDKLPYFNDDEILDIFQQRPQLNRAFQVILAAARSGHRERANWPAFEVDLIFEWRHNELLDKVPICDYMYVFDDPTSLQRDFLGTTLLDNEDSGACKVLIAYDHYEKSHAMLSTERVERNDPAPCPFYSCCQLPLRISCADICTGRPWRIFEVSHATDGKYCWYGSAVAEFKGPVIS
jgi:hypothetical protein